MYRDAAEWQNYSSMFHPGAYITASYSQGRLDDFIASSKEGFEGQIPRGPFPLSCIGSVGKRLTSRVIARLAR
jgi:hypothetical protein